MCCLMLWKVAERRRIIASKCGMVVQKRMACGVRFGIVSWRTATVLAVTTLLAMLLMWLDDRYRCLD